MEIHNLTLDNCTTARGTVVVVDVCRAFTTAAYAFAAGAAKIYLVSRVDEAFALREKIPGALLMGEESGLPIPGFDYWNSPSEIAGLDLTGRTLIQRTSAGTQGVVRTKHAERLIAASFVCASATAQDIRQAKPDTVTFVNTGVWKNFGDEDKACSDYIARLIQGSEPNPDPYIERARSWVKNLERFSDLHVRQRFLNDLEYCLKVDRFNFCMVVTVQDSLIWINRPDHGGN